MTAANEEQAVAHATLPPLACRPSPPQGGRSGSRSRPGAGLRETAAAESNAVDATSRMHRAPRGERRHPRSASAGHLLHRGGATAAAFSHPPAPPSAPPECAAPSRPVRSPAPSPGPGGLPCIRRCRRCWRRARAPTTMSLICTSPCARSSPPWMTTQGAPRRSAYFICGFMPDAAEIHFGADAGLAQLRATILW